MTISSKDILAALSKTGFPLEHRVTEAFRKKKWNTLSGRYYIDDIDGQARELDLVAYRIIKTAGVDVVSCVLISCKKEGENAWAFLSRPAPAGDTNHDWCPIDIWADEEPLATYLGTGKWKAEYEKKARADQPDFHVVTRDVFAYQVIAPPGPQQRTTKAESKAPPSKAAKSVNDSPIFSSVTGLLKALHYKKNALPDRMKGRKRVYVFHLAVVLDGEMVDVRFEASDPQVTPAASILHLARYIVAGSRTSALVHFTQVAELDGFVSRVDSLAAFDAEQVGGLVPKAYESILHTREVQTYFAKRMRSSLIFAISRDLRETGISETASELDIVSGDAGLLTFEVDVEPEGIAVLNAEGSHARTEAARLLAKWAKFTGKFEFAFNFPF